jgi:putative FmdB family regulatory protein
MPIYEYQCIECGHELEKLQKLNDPPLTDCPACGKATLQKRVSAAGFRLKGGGWYETDFKGKDKRNAAKTDSGTKSDAKTDAGAKSTPSADKKAD